MTPATARIVLIDDEPLVRELVGLVLSDEGYGVWQAATAAAGLRAILEVRPHLVLLDLHLPDLTPGRLVADVVAAAGSAKILVFSGDTSSLEDLSPAAAAAIDGRLLKPIRPSLLVERVRSALREQRLVQTR